MSIDREDIINNNCQACSHMNFSCDTGSYFSCSESDFLDEKGKCEDFVGHKSWDSICCTNCKHMNWWYGNSWDCNACYCEKNMKRTCKNEDLSEDGEFHGHTYGGY